MLQHIFNYQVLCSTHCALRRFSHCWTRWLQQGQVSIVSCSASCRGRGGFHGGGQSKPGLFASQDKTRGDPGRGRSGLLLDPYDPSCGGLMRTRYAMWQVSYVAQTRRAVWKPHYYLESDQVYNDIKDYNPLKR